MDTLEGVTMETTKRVDVDKTIEEAKDAITVRRVFGEPYVKNGVTVILAARVQGGAGGGSGEAPGGKDVEEGLGSASARSRWAPT